MLEMSAAKSPALALTGAAMPAVPAAMSADGAQIVDFSMVLAGATLAGEAPALMNGMLVQPEADTPPAPELLPNPATLPGKSGIPGNSNGKNLPAGKLPAPRAAAVLAEKAPRKQPSESADWNDASSVTAPEPDASSTAAPVDAPPVAAFPAAMAPAEVTAINVARSQTTNKEAVEEPQQTLVRQQPQMVAVKASRGAVEPAAANLASPSGPSDHADKLGSPALARHAAPGAIAILPDDPLVATLQTSITPVNLVPTQGEPLVRQATETATAAAPVQSVQAPGTSPVLLPATPMTTLAVNLQAASSEAPAPQDRSPSLIVANQPERIEAAVLPAILATADKDHKAAHTATSPAPVVATETATPFARAEMDASTLAAEFRSAPAPAAPTSSASTTPSTPTQDIAALVDRIADARAAASPHTIRASLVHEDFGPVSVNLRTEASHIQVTLGSADPTFAPAVQAAAAASLAGSSDDANARREATAPQSFTPTQDTSARAETSSQQQAARDRAPAPERPAGREAPGRQAHASAERDPSSPASRRRGGIYA